MNPLPHSAIIHPSRRAPALAALLGLALAAATATPAEAFCGFYVAKADTKLFNKASQVVLARQNNATVLTMVNDYDGDPKEFALVVPVPTFLEREQIHVTEKKVIDHLDAYTSPRLVEYFDPDPCIAMMYKSMQAPSSAARSDAGKDERARSQGVTIEASYTVGEYDILILSAKESDGLESWLNENGYRIPPGATDVIGSYLRQKMRFFVAKVNLGEKAKLGVKTLRPLQVAFESPKFMLPIRLGTVNADGPQELFIYTLTPRGRVETANYRTVKLPSDVDLPLYVKGEFGAFYKAMFDTQVRSENMRVVFQEYAWDMGWCDPCAADPLSAAELRELGVFWQNDGASGPAPRVRPAHRRRAERLRHAAACALRPRSLSRGSRLPGDGRSHEFPGPLHPPASMDGTVDLRRRARLPPDAGQAPARGGPQSGATDRLGLRSNRPQDGSRLGGSGGGIRPGFEILAEIVGRQVSRGFAPNRLLPCTRLRSRAIRAGFRSPRSPGCSFMAGAGSGSTSRCRASR